MGQTTLTLTLTLTRAGPRYHARARARARGRARVCNSQKRTLAICNGFGCSNLDGARAMHVREWEVRIREYGWVSGRVGECVRVCVRARGVQVHASR